MWPDVWTSALRPGPPSDPAELELARLGMWMGSLGRLGAWVPTPLPQAGLRALGGHFPWTFWAPPAPTLCWTPGSPGRICPGQSCGRAGSPVVHVGSPILLALGAGPLGDLTPSTTHQDVLVGTWLPRAAASWRCHWRPHPQGWPPAHQIPELGVITFLPSRQWPAPGVALFGRLSP